MPAHSNSAPAVWHAGVNAGRPVTELAEETPIEHRFGWRPTPHAPHSSAA